jgi:hypothetical protein
MSIEQDEQSGFNNTFSDEPVAIEEIETASEPEQVVEIEVEEAPEVVEQAPEPDVREELRALSERFNSVPDELRKVQGKYGELHRTLQELRQPQAIKIDAEKLREAMTDYPEFADQIAAGLNAAIQVNASPQQGFDPAKFDEVVSSRVNQATDAMNRKVQMLTLALEHKDWRQVSGSPEFQKWKSALPSDEQQQLDNSWDADYLSEKISAYKATIKEVDAKKATKAKVIQAAVTPKGSSASMPATDSEADAFRRAINGS